MKDLEERSRIVRINDKIIITNYKCMFSWLNDLNICEFNPTDSEKYEKIMLFRNPYDRTISFFLSFMVYWPNDFGIKYNPVKYGWFIDILKEQEGFDFDNYKLLLKSNNLIELFKIYLNFLGKVKNRNAHIHSQVKIIQDNKFNINTYINIDKKDDMIILEKKVKQNIKISYDSHPNHKKLLKNFLNENIHYKNIIYDIYKDDFQFFFQ